LFGTVVTGVGWPPVATVVPPGVNGGPSCGPSGSVVDGVSVVGVAVVVVVTGSVVVPPPPPLGAGAGAGVGVGDGQTGSVVWYQRRNGYPLPSQIPHVFAGVDPGSQPSKMLHVAASKVEKVFICAVVFPVPKLNPL
jgi:hypothetical protein